MSTRDYASKALGFIVSRVERKGENIDEIDESDEINEVGEERLGVTETACETWKCTRVVAKNIHWKIGVASEES